MLENSDHQDLGKRLEQYCYQYFIPVEFFFEIINDQKVLPMLRGKGMEYHAFLLLQQQLNPSEWIVQKLNLSPQPGSPDQDIGITHRRTGQILSAESKSAVRGSMNSGLKSREYKAPHFKVKSHRSRSNIKLADTSNDRYRWDAFDILLTNPSNAIYAGKTLGDELELIDDPRLWDILSAHYKISTHEALIKAAHNDWRFVIPGEIADSNGFIPRTPVVYLENDPHWQPLIHLESKIKEVVRQRHASSRKPPRN